jgi:hypothetical protein
MHLPLTLHTASLPTDPHIHQIMGISKVHVSPLVEREEAELVMSNFRHTLTVSTR